MEEKANTAKKEKLQAVEEEVTPLTFDKVMQDLMEKGESERIIDISRNH